MNTEIPFARMYCSDPAIMMMASCVYSGELSVTITVFVAHNFSPSAASVLVYMSRTNELIGMNIIGWSPVGQGRWTAVISFKGFSRPYMRWINVALQCNTGNV
ncbi:MAG: hypothetical protein ACYCOU_02805 [Sulfobacillus sp.]